LANTLILVSGLAFGALALSKAGTTTSWFTRVLRRFKKNDVAAPPVITHDNGWTLIHCDDAASFNLWLGRDEEGLPIKDGEEPSLGSHLLVELYGCDEDSLRLESTVGGAMREAAVESEATVVAQSFHEFKPWGVSGAVIIQESHYTIHTWPEHGYAAVDLFYCGGTVKVHKAIEVLQQQFKPTRIKFLVVRRGLDSEVHR
jgi:S-adenosylmethionine decarboxylase